MSKTWLETVQEALVGKTVTGVREQETETEQRTGVVLTLNDGTEFFFGVDFDDVDLVGETWEG